MRSLFTAPAAWSGGHYELHMRLPEQIGTAQALAALWGSPQLHGCFQRHDIAPDQQAALDIANLPAEGHLYGTTLLEQGQECACGSFITTIGSSTRWMCLYLPLGSLGTIFPLGAYPFDPSTPERERALRQIDAWLRALATQLYQSLPFALAIVGFDCELADMTEQTIPEQRRDGFLTPQGNHLRWHPPTMHI